MSRTTGGTATPTEDVQVAQRALLGPLMGTLEDCAGGCGQRLLPYRVYQSFDKVKRRQLKALGVNRSSSFGRCGICVTAGRVGNFGRDYTKRTGKIPQEMLERLPEIWNEIQVAGGGTPELGKRLGVSRERARQLVSKHGLPRTHASKERSEAFVEELEFLAGFRLGVQEMAARFGMDPDLFVKKVDNLRHNGKTTVEFNGYFREEWAAA